MVLIIFIILAYFMTYIKRDNMPIKYILSLFHSYSSNSFSCFQNIGNKNSWRNKTNPVKTVVYPKKISSENKSAKMTIVIHSWPTVNHSRLTLLAEKIITNWLATKTAWINCSKNSECILYLLIKNYPRTFYYALWIF